MHYLNEICRAHEYLEKAQLRIAVDFDAPIFGCEMGIAYGGGIERLGRLWHSYGIVWGFDTFQGHPKQLANICPDTKAAGGQEAHAAYCMDPWYQQFGTGEVGYGFIRAELDRQGLHNVILVKGLIDEKTDISYIPHLHYAMLDMDFPLSMRNGYRLVRDKITRGGYLCLHDVIPAGHIAGMDRFYSEVLADGLWDVVSEHPECYLAVLRRK